MIKKIFRNTLEHFPALALLLRNLRDQLDRRDVLLQTPWGFRMGGHAEMAAGAFEPEETRLVRDLLPQVDILVNIGANVGYYCCHALSLGKNVVAVEPLERNLYYLLKNIRGNKWESQVQVFPVALGSETNVLELWGGGTGASLVKGWAGMPQSYVRLVPVLTLDRIIGDSLKKKRALILVDIEGAELRMLEGALGVLGHEPRPVWMVEISFSENQPRGTSMNPSFVATFELFFKFGYRAFTADASMTELNLADVVQVSLGTRMLTTHNFLFQ